MSVAWQNNPLSGYLANLNASRDRRAAETDRRIREARHDALLSQQLVNQFITQNASALTQEEIGEMGGIRDPGEAMSQIGGMAGTVGRRREQGAQSDKTLEMLEVLSSIPGATGGNPERAAALAATLQDELVQRSKMIPEMRPSDAAIGSRVKYGKAKAEVLEYARAQEDLKFRKEQASIEAKERRMLKARADTDYFLYLDKKAADVGLPRGSSSASITMAERMSSAGELDPTKIAQMSKLDKAVSIYNGKLEDNWDPNKPGNLRRLMSLTVSYPSDNIPGPAMFKEGWFDDQQNISIYTYPEFRAHVLPPLFELADQGEEWAVNYLNFLAERALEGSHPGLSALRGSIAQSDAPLVNYEMETPVSLAAEDVQQPGRTELSPYERPPEMSQIRSAPAIRALAEKLAELHGSAAGGKGVEPLLQQLGVVRRK